MDRSASIPVVPLPADFRISIAFQCIKIGLGMRVAVTLGMGQVYEDRADGHARSLESILFPASTHEKIGRTMFRLVGSCELFVVHRDAPPVLHPVLRLFFRQLAQNLRIVFATLFELLHLPHVDVGFEVPSQTRNIGNTEITRVEELVRGAIGNMKDRARKKVVTGVIENHESFATLNVNGFLTVKMLASVPADRDFGFHETAATRGEAELRRDHQGGLVILDRAHPSEIFGPRYSRRLIDLLLIVFRPFQPITVKIAHRSSSMRPMVPIDHLPNGGVVGCQLEGLWAGPNLPSKSEAGKGQKGSF